MEYHLEILKAKEISGYVKAIYGEKNLGLIRLLSSVPYFRRAIVRGKLQELTGMSLISFEKYLREQHQLFYKYDGSTFRIERLVGKSSVLVTSFQDDNIFSVGGAVVDTIRDMYPDVNSLSSIPVVSLGRGLAVDHMLVGIDIPAICKYIALLPQSYIDDRVTTDINNYRKLVEEGIAEAVDKYKVLDALHVLYVQLRKQPQQVIELQDLPPCEKIDFMEVCLGLKKASVVMPKGAKIPSTLMATLKEAHPEGEAREGGFYIKGDVVLDPFQYIGSTIVDITVPDLTNLPPDDANISPQDPYEAGETSDCRRIGVVSEVTMVGPGFGIAVDLVLQYFDTNINELQPKEKEIALYGFTGGEEAFKKMSHASQKNITKTVGLGEYKSLEVIYKLASFLENHLKNRVSGITKEQFALMAAGRIVAWKGNWVIDPDGTWSKVK